MATEHMTAPTTSRAGGPGQQPHWSDSYRDELSRCVGDHPSSAVLTAFGSGVAIGVGLGLVLASVTAPRKLSRRQRAEALGNRIMDSFHDYIPEVLARRMS